MLICSNYVLTARHMMHSYAGKYISFVGTNNDLHTVKCLGVTNIVQPGIRTNQLYTDVLILALENALPSTVHRVKLLPSSAVNKMPFFTNATISSSCLAVRFPVITGNQLKQAFVRDAWYEYIREVLPADPSSYEYYYNGWRFNALASSSMPSFSGDSCGGDGGSPYWVVINHELVLLGHVTWPDGGPVYGFNIDRINDAIGGLSVSLSIPRDYVSAADLSSLPDL